MYTYKHVRLPTAITCGSMEGRRGCTSVYVSAGYGQGCIHDSASAGFRLLGFRVLGFRVCGQTPSWSTCVLTPFGFPRTNQ